MGWVTAQNAITYNLYPGTKYLGKSLEDGLSLCDLTQYRKESEHVKLLFDDDSIVELYSANELEKKGIKVSTENLSRKQLPMLNLFYLHDEGWVLEDASRISKEEASRRLEKIRN